MVILRRQEPAHELIERIQNYRLEDQGVSLPQQAPANDLRTYGVGAQILRDLGIRRMRIMGAPKRMHGLPGFDLEVVEYVS